MNKYSIAGLFTKKFNTQKSTKKFKLIFFAVTTITSKATIDDATAFKVQITTAKTFLFSLQPDQDNPLQFSGLFTSLWLNGYTILPTSAIGSCIWPTAVWALGLILERFPGGEIRQIETLPNTHICTIRKIKGTTVLYFCENKIKQKL